MKFGQSVEHNMRNIFFLKNHTQNAMETLFPDPFLKKSKLSISLDQYSKVHIACFYGMPSRELSEHIETKV